MKKIVSIVRKPSAPLGGQRIPRPNRLLLQLKMSPPAYQTILDRQIPSVSLPDGAGTVRVIAGEFGGVKGPAHTFTPINLWDLRLKTYQCAES